MESGHDDAVRHLLQILGNIEQGRIVCDISPRTVRMERMCDVLLQALGKNPLAKGLVRDSARKLQRTRAWLRAEGISDIFVSSCEELAPQLVKALIDLAVESDASLWLIAASEPALRRRIPPDHRVDWIAAETFCARWAASDHVDAPPRPTPFPDIPDEDFATFLDAARQTLPPRALARVRAAWQHGIEQAQQVLAQRRGDTMRQLAVLVRRLVAEAGDTSETVSTLRGVQTALFLDGRWHLTIDLVRLNNGSRIVERQLLEREGGTLLRRYMGSERPTAAVVAAASHANSGEIAALRLSDISPDGSEVTLAGGTFPIPFNLCALPRAQRELRQLDGASSDAPLFISESTRGIADVTARHVQRWLREVSYETGLPFLVPNTARQAPTPERWLRTHGMTLRAL